MQRIFDFAKRQIARHRSFLLYGSISVFVTVIDIVVCRISEGFFSPVVSNTLGVVTGFIVQYLLASRHVYNSENARTFIIFFLTFVLGLILANSIVFLCRHILFDDSDTVLAFLISKAFSIVVSFFATYFLRNKFIAGKK